MMIPETKQRLEAALHDLQLYLVQQRTTADLRDSVASFVPSNSVLYVNLRASKLQQFDLDDAVTAACSWLTLSFITLLGVHAGGSKPGGDGERGVPDRTRAVDRRCGHGLIMPDPGGSVPRDQAWALHPFTHGGRMSCTTPDPSHSSVSPPIVASTCVISIAVVCDGKWLEHAAAASFRSSREWLRIVLLGAAVPGCLELLFCRHTVHFLPHLVLWGRK